MPLNRNDAYAFILDNHRRRGYIVSHRGDCSVVNHDAMTLLRDLPTLPHDAHTTAAFLQQARTYGWIIETEQTPRTVRTVTTPYHLKRIQLELLLQCNLECAHCYCSSSPTAPRGLPTPQLYSLIDQAAAMGAIYLDITGGEPLLRKDIFDILVHAQTRGLITSLFTNGTPVTTTVAQRLAKCHIASIQTSLDALSPALHDRFRGRSGAFQQTIRGITRLREAGIPVSVTVMVHRHNIHELKALTDFIANTLRVPFRLDRVIPAGRAASNDTIALSAPEFYQRVRELYPADKALISRVCDGASALIDKQHIEPSCGVGTSYCFIKHNGAVVLCPTMTPAESPQFRAGSFPTQSLREIWMDHPTFQQFRGIQCQNIDICPAAQQCRGGCRSNAYLLHGTVTAPDELHCNLHKNRQTQYVNYLQRY
jgi:radical SAM protein with 4Fe4S-binding SPASM domain